MPNTYLQTLSRQYPGLFVIMLDQSVSMTEEVKDSGQSKASLVTLYVNSIISKMIEYAQIDEFTAKRKNYAYVSILGYNDRVFPLLPTGNTPVSLPDLDEMVRANVYVERKIVDDSGRVVRHLREKVKVWIEPKADGNTDMTYAFEEAETIIRNWLNSEPEYISAQLNMQMPRHKSFPPVLINITDAKHNGDRDPEEVVKRISKLRTDDGNVLIYNCHVTHEGMKPCVFPNDINEVRTQTRSRQAERMFQMSSVIPETLRQKAQHVMQMPIPAGARCFVYNANPDILLKFLTWTTLGRAGSKEN